MSAFLPILRYQMRDVVRSRWLPGYAVFFLLLTEALFYFGDGAGERVLVSLVNVVLLLTPLVSVAFGTFYLYGAREFVEMLLSQPVKRSTLYGGLYAGLAIPFSAAFVLGSGIPFFVHTGTASLGGAAAIFLVGVLITLAFTALAFLIAVGVEERVHGMGLSIGAWLVAAVLYDGLVLAVAAAFSSYPLEKAMIALMLLNPIDLARVLLLLQFDVAALMGYTGAVFEQFFGSGLGIAIAGTALLAWAAFPLVAGMRVFARKDL
ncbi:MAG TPA: ABC transporter permease subunit [Rhodothermales bacterium]